MARRSGAPSRLTQIHRATGLGLLRLSLRPETSAPEAVAAKGCAHLGHGFAASFFDFPVLQMAEAEEATALGALGGGRPVTVRLAAQALAVAPGHRLLIDEVVL